ncbi:MAG: DUF4149 domain-containing protein [Verrucomicrobia bacterium]|nr:DUF4149 domain-containing protein [Verrucomicrobiota bacterium]
MITFLRLVGIFNAAIWFGAAAFFTFGVGPAFFAPDMINLVGRPRAGVAVQMILDRYFVVQHWCGVIALVHLVAEWLYTGRPLSKLTLSILVVMLGLGLAGHYGLQPRLNRLHLTMYGLRSTPEQAEQARRSFQTWHGFAQGLNLLMLVGMVYYLWQVSQPPAVSRFLRANRFQLE